MSDTQIRISDYIIGRIADEGVRHIFMVSGGGGMFLIDSLGHRDDIQFICNHHEQASSMAAEAYWRMTGKPGVALVTTGPAGTNAITGLMCAWTDSIPMLVLSGQVKSNSLIGNTGLRQRGVHEANITHIVSSITKYAVTITDPTEVAYHIEKALFLCRNGRPGPVWIDVPLDIQGAMINPAAFKLFDPVAECLAIVPAPQSVQIDQLMSWLVDAERPVILAGYGIKLAGLEERFRGFADQLGVPVTLTKNAFELLHHDHPLLAGQVGTYGQRSGNFAIQNSDLLICLGTRLCNPVVGYETDLFARGARIVDVDIDPLQLQHALVRIDLPIHAHLAPFLDQLEAALVDKELPNISAWHEKIRHWREIFPNVTTEMRACTKYVDAYYFFEVLSEEMSSDIPMVWDQGATYFCSTVAFKLKQGQRAFSNGGFTPMGYGLPAAIGAGFANDGKPLVCVHGDGGLQMNVQELQTIRHHQLPIKLFVFNNQGYLSIKHTQQAYFDSFLVGSDPSSGVSCPDTVKLAGGYDLPARRIATHDGMREAIREALAYPGPIVIDVVLDPFQKFEPRVTSYRLPDGRMRSNPLEDMSPLIDRDLFRQEMIVTPVEATDSAMPLRK